MRSTARAAPRQSRPCRIVESIAIAQDATPNAVEYLPEDLERLIVGCRDTGLAFLGSIHTHPRNGAPHPSYGDNQSSLHSGELIGIDSTCRRKGRLRHDVQWYLAQLPIADIRCE